MKNASLVFALILLSCLQNSESFACYSTTTTTGFASHKIRPSSFFQSRCQALNNNNNLIFRILSTPTSDNDTNEIDVTNLSESEKKEVVGNLVADDEWNGMAMELSELIKAAVVEDIKTKGRDFLGKDSYQVGDISKEIDSRVKDGIANLRGKDDYELGDFVLALDEISKDLTEQITGKPYEAGDLSKEIDKRIKIAVANYIGKESYEAGDLTRAIAEKVSTRVEELTANYEFGDITREINRRREEWVKDFIGKENYQFGDLTKTAFTKFTGKDNYEFGDVTKKILGDFFGKKDTK